MSNIIPFDYQGKEVRTIVDEAGNPWWVARDACHILNYSDPDQALNKLDKDEKLIRKIYGSGQMRDMWTINEPGLYALILRSTKPEAKKFKKWVTHNVLPTIRKTGTYTVKTPDSIVPTSKEFKAAVQMAKAAGLKGNQAVLAANKLTKKITSCDCLALLDATHLIKEVQEADYNPTTLGKVFFDGISAQKVNKMLEDKGLAESYRDNKGNLCRKPTVKGMPYAVLKDTGKSHSDGTPVQQLFWRESVVAVLKVA